MGDLTFNCPNCRQSLEAPEEMVGETIKCPTCQAPIKITKPPSKNQLKITKLPPQPRLETEHPAAGKGMSSTNCPQSFCGSKIPTGNKIQLKTEQAPSHNELSENKPCPFCGETILRSAIKCKHCREFLNRPIKIEWTTLAKSKITINVIAIVIMVVICGTGYFIYNRITGHAEKIYPDGSKFIGTLKDGKSNGRGTFISTNGQKYVGEFKDDKFNGQGTLTSTSGVKYVGKFSDGWFCGQGTLTGPDGLKISGNFDKEGKINGQGEKTYPNGRKYVGEFYDGECNGYGTLTDPDGSKYVGEFKNDMINGHGTLIDTDGSKRVGEFENNKLIRKISN